uniref:Replicase n=1 Tax=Fairlight virus TaxID=2485869 RepID=A0A3G3BTC9_9VIRU|nr:RNA-dependent RNA polymerase [Fairlight virus]
MQRNFVEAEISNLKISPNGLLNSHLNSPLRSPPLHRLAAFLEKETPLKKRTEKRDADLLMAHLDPNQEVSFDFTHGISILNRHLKKKDTVTHTLVTQLDSKAREVAKELLLTQYPSLKKMGASVDLDNLTWRPSDAEARSNNLRDTLLQLAWGTSADAEVVPEILHASHPQLTKGVRHWDSGGGLHIAVTETYACMRDTHSQLVMTRDQFLCLSDMVHQRAICLHACRLAAELGSSLYPSVPQLEHIFNWGDEILELHGNEGYALISKWESLCTGVLLQHNPDPLVANSAFLEEMMKAFDEEAIKLNSSITSGPIVEWLRQAGKENPHVVSQAFGLYRIWGHPVVNPLRGVAKLRAVACKPKAANHTLTDRVTCKAKEMFAFNFFRKNRRWPHMDVERLPESSVLKQRVKKGEALSRHHKLYRMLDWTEVRFLKNFNVMENLELSDMISDKATSLPKSELLPNLERRHSIGASWERAVLVRHMQQLETCPKEILDLVSKEGFGEDESVVGVCPKERELKMEPRMFGLLPLRKRMYVVITEAMLANDILPYFPDITMMDDSITLTKKIIQMTHQGSALKSIMITLDFEKWNSHMRKEETLDIFQMFDDLYGLTDVFTRSHEMFDSAQLYLADSSYLPSVDRKNNRLMEDEGCWSGHLGGIEGLRQKGWTIVTNAMLRLIADDMNMNISIMGQGDNQVMKCIHPKDLTDQEVMSRHKEFMTRLFDMTSQYGPPLKPSETWCSSNFFIYGKYPVLKGVPLSLSLKRLVRIFPTSNDGFPSFDVACSSIFANASAATQHEVSPLIPYIVAIQEVVRAFYYHMGSSGLHPRSLIKELEERKIVKIPQENSHPLVLRDPVTKRQIDSIQRLNTDFLVSLLLHPKSLGGFSVQLLGSLCIRGHPDPLTLDISLLKTAYTNGTSRVKKAVTMILSPVLSPAVSPAMLVQDPVAINLLSPSTASDVVKRKVTTALRSASWIVNAKIKEFIHLSCDGSDALCEYLLLMSPLNPRVAHEIFQATLFGRAQHMVNQLNKTNTMIKITRKMHGIDLLAVAAKADVAHWAVILYQQQACGSLLWDSSKCSTEWAQTLRDHSWKTTVTGVTVASPFEMFQVYPTQTADCQSESHPNPSTGYLLCRAGSQGSTPDILKGKKIGAIMPYVGNKTVEKISALAKEYSRQVPPVLSAAFLLQKLQGWGVEVGSPFSDLLNRLVTALCNKDPKELYPLHDNIKGSLEHRFLDHATKHGGSLPILYSPATAWYLSSDTLAQYARGAGNYNLHFQATYTCVLTCLATAGQSPPPACLHYHQVCSSCCVPIYERLLQLPTSSVSLEKLIPSRPNNPFCWVNLDCLPKVQPQLYPRLDPNRLGPGELTDLLSVAMGRELAYQVRKSVTGYHMSDIGISRKSIPVPWIYKADPVTAIEAMTICLISYVSKDISFVFEQEGSRAALTLVLEHMNRLSNNLFFHMADLEARPEFFEPLTRGPYFHSPSAGTPVSVSESAANWKSILADTLHLWLISDYKPSTVLNLLPSVGEPSDADFNPATLQQLCKMISAFPEDDIMAASVWRCWNRVHSSTRALQQDHSLETVESIVKFGGSTLDQRILSTASRASMPSTFELLTEDLDLLSKRAEPYSCGDLGETQPITRSDIPRRGSETLVAFTSNHRASTCVEIADRMMTPPPVDTAHWLNIWKTEGITTLAPYKILSLGDVLPPNCNKIACLGEGAGGLLSTLARMYPNAKIFYNSLLSPETACSQVLPSFLPSGVMITPGVKDRLIGMSFTTDTPSDLTHEDYASRAGKAVQGPFDLITCDAEGDGWDTPVKGLQLAHTFCHLSMVWKASHGILKTYGLSPHLVGAQVAILLHHYRVVGVCRSSMSSPDNTELYLCGAGRELCPDPLGPFPNSTKLSTTLVEPALRRLRQKLMDYDYQASHAPKDIILKYSQLLETSSSIHKNLSLINRLCPGKLWASEMVIYPVHTIESILESGAPLMKGQTRRFMHKFMSGMLTAPIIKEYLLFHGIWLVLALNSVGLPNCEEELRTGVLLVYLNRQGRTTTAFSSVSSPLWGLGMPGAVAVYPLSEHWESKHYKLCFRAAGAILKIAPGLLISPSRTLSRASLPRNPSLTPAILHWPLYVGKLGEGS